MNEDTWLQNLPAPCRATIAAYADPHPPGGAPRARMASRAIAQFAAGWSSDRGDFKAEVYRLMRFLASVGQTTLHQPGVDNAMRYTVAGGIPDDPAVAAALFARRADEVERALDAVRERVAALGATMLSDGDTVLVHDYGPIQQAPATRAAEEGKHLTVIATACRSRRTHGIRVAEEARKVGHAATVVTDAGVGWVMQRGGLRAAFVGADAFMADGSVLTTPGVLAIAALGARFGVPVYACCDLWRLMPSLPPDLVELNDAPDPDGVPEAMEWEAAGFQYLNPLIDVAPGEFLAGFLTEAGLIAPQEVGAVAQRLYQLGGDETALH